MEWKRREHAGFLMNVWQWLQSAREPGFRVFESVGIHVLACGKLERIDRYFFETRVTDQVKMASVAGNTTRGTARTFSDFDVSFACL